MKGRPRNERDYLMGPRVKAEAATKAKKKKVRKENIKKGSKSNIKHVQFLNGGCGAKAGQRSLAMALDASSARKECQC